MWSSSSEAFRFLPLLSFFFSSSLLPVMVSFSFLSVALLLPFLSGRAPRIPDNKVFVGGLAPTFMFFPLLYFFLFFSPLFLFLPFLLIPDNKVFVESLAPTFKFFPLPSSLFPL